MQKSNIGHEENSLLNFKSVALISLGAAATALSIGRRVVSKRLIQHQSSRLHLKQGKSASVVRATHSVESMYFHMWDQKLARPEMGQIYTLKGPKSTPQLVAKALRNLKNVQPTMQMGAHQYNGKWFFHRFSDSDARVDIKLMEGDREAFQMEVEKYLNEPNKLIDREDLLWRALVMTDKKQDLHYVVWWAFHAITDGFSRMTFSRDLLHELDRLHTLGEAAPPLEKRTKSDSIASPSLYERLEAFPEWKLLPWWPKWIPKVANAIISNITSPNRGMIPIEMPAVAAERRSRVVFRSGQVGLMKRFHRMCKGKDVSVTAGLIGVYLAQMRDHYELAEGLELKFFLPINLRDRVASKMKEDVVFYGCGIHTPLLKLHIAGGGDQGIWAMAREVQSKCLGEKSLRLGIVEAENFVQNAIALFEAAPKSAFDALLANPDERALIGFSNSGVFSGEEYPRKVGEFSIEEIGSCFPTGPVTGVPSLFCYTFHDRTFMSLTYSDPLFSEATATRLLEGIFKSIESMTDSQNHH